MTLRPGLTLLDYFDADVSGRDFAHGKPDPEIFLTAARELGVTPRSAIVIEDASAGVQAAKAGGMAAIGVARAGDAGLLAAADADLVVTTLDDVDTTALGEGRLARRQALSGTATLSRLYRAAAQPGRIFMPPPAVIAPVIDAATCLDVRLPACSAQIRNCGPGSHVEPAQPRLPARASRSRPDS